MVIVQLTGGLGNQMFEYAAGYVAAKHAGTIVKVDSLYYKDTSKRMHRFCYRPYALSLFNISAEEATAEEIRNFTLPRIYNKYVYNVMHRLVREKNVYTEEMIDDRSKIIDLPSSCYLKGSFQKYEYFQDEIAEIETEFTFKDILLKSCNDIARKIRLAKDSVCVVFRRGDYVGHPFLDILNLDYYY